MWSDEYERRAAEMRQRTERDRLAARLGHEQLRIAEAMGPTVAVERHYTVKELATIWKLSGTSISRLFRDEPGTDRTHGRPATPQVSRKQKKKTAVRILNPADGCG